MSLRSSDALVQKLISDFQRMETTFALSESMLGTLASKQVFGLSVCAMFRLI